MPQTNYPQRIYSSKVTTQPLSPAGTAGAPISGTVWVDVPGGPTLTFTPPNNCRAVITAGGSLWYTGTTIGLATPLGIDLGIYVVGGIYPTVAATPEAWEENGYVANGAPNACTLAGEVDLVGGVSYAFNLRWKPNSSASITAGQMVSGAGNSPFSPTYIHIVLGD